MAHSFSHASLEKMEYIFDLHIKKLSAAIIAQGCTTFDLKNLIAYYAYDIMGEVIFNADFGSQDAANPIMLPPINNHIWLGCLYGMLPSLLPYSMQYSRWIPSSWLQDKLRSRAALRQKITAHVTTELAKDKTIERQNILNRLVNARDPETGEELSEDAISSEAFGFLVAGSHTTSGSLTLLFHHLLYAPDAGDQLTRELEHAMPRVIENDDQTIPAFAGLEQRLPYLTACIRESFRVSPVFTMPLPRTVIEPDGMDIDGHHVPQGVGSNRVPSRTVQTLLTHASRPTCHYAIK
jgi:cytochrome P450